MTQAASAPGKLVLLGDYAVLEGGLALVAAVNRRAEGRVASNAPPSGVVQAVCRRAGAEALSVRIDTSGFLGPEGTKLGIGSSAAVAVVTAALATGRGDERCLETALKGHRDAAGGVGSGIDVAASYYGGVIASRNQPSPVEPLGSRLPGLELSVLFARESASTSELIRACRGHPRWPAWMSVMKPLAEQGVDAWRRGEAPRFLEVVRRYGRAMEGMGRDADVPVVTETIRKVMDAAEKRGGAAKPSGAGGGDVVVLFSQDPALGAQAAEESGALLLDLGVERTGLRRS